MAPPPTRDRRSVGPDDPPPSDESLLARAAGGDEGAFESLYVRHARALMAFAYHLTSDRGFAEDAVQETFLRVWRFAGGFRADGRFLPWAYRIARNVVFERGAAWRRARGAGGDALPAAAPPAGSPAEAPGETSARGVEVAAALREALLALSQPLREVFVLVRLCGRPYAEVAEVLEVPEGTVKSRMSAAEETLRRRLEKFL